MAGSYQTRLGNAPEEGIKAPVVVATLVNIAITGEQLIEGVNVVDGDRVLVRAQTDSSENGIYNVSGVAWTRTHDWNAANDVINGVLVGDASNGAIYQAFFNGEYTPDVTDVIFQPSQAGVFIGAVVYDRVSTLKAASPAIGDLVRTKGYTTAGDGGGADYLIAVSQAVDGYGDHVLANGNVALLQVIGGANVRQFGAAGDGVTDDRAVIQAAVNIDAGSVYLPAGDYLLSLTTNVNGLALSNPVRCHGDGKGVTTLTIDYAATKFGTGVSVNSENVIIADMTVDINADNGSTVAIGLGQNSAGFKLIDCEVTGSRSLTTQYWPHGIKLSDDANADNVEIKGNKFHGLQIILFSSNFFGLSGNISSGWNISGNSFKGCSAGITFNSQFSDSGADMPWRHITVTGNTFDDLGKHLGGDSMAYLTITGNSFINMNVGDGDAAIHLENLGENLVVADNTIHCASGGGIWVYPLTRNYSITGNVIEGPYIRADTDDPSTYSTPNVDVVGIWLVNNGDGEPENVVVSGNVVTSCSSGIRVSNPYDNPIVQGNHISLCDAGIWANSSSALNVSGNTVKKCKYMYDMSSMRGVVGKNLGVDCTNLAYSPLDDFALLGLQWAVELTGNLAASSTTSIDLFTAPERMEVDVISNIVRDSLASDHFIGTSTITKDNTPTFTATRGYYISTGNITLGAIPFSESAGTLRVDIFNNVASIQNAKMDLDFDGMMLWT